MLKFISLFFLIFLTHEAISSEARGFYSRGRLVDGENILSRAGHVQKLFVERGRLYTTTEMNDLIQSVVSSVKIIYPDLELIQIGDLSAEKGGRVSRHQSHQNGLDADIVYIRKNKYVQPSTSPEWEEEFAINGKVTENFDIDRNWTLITEFIKQGNVGRIFVDEQIKLLYCNKFKKEGTLEINSSYLRRLRTLPHHSTHLHLRIKCPVEAKRCKDQTEPPVGTGC